MRWFHGGFLKYLDDFFIASVIFIIVAEKWSDSLIDRAHICVEKTCALVMVAHGIEEIVAFVS